jgi:uncharacterized protein (TIGR03435 family)
MKCIDNNVKEHRRYGMFSLVSAVLCISGLGVSRSQELWGTAGVAAQALPPGDPGRTFDVISIKQQKKDMREMIVRVRNELHSSQFYATGEPILALIQIAYGVRYDQIVDVPGWARDEIYEVRAQGGEEADKMLAHMNDADAERTKQQMLQAMLADRFRLTVHRSVREAKILALIVARHGSKLTLAGPTDGNTNTTGAADVGVVPRIEGRGDSRGLYRSISDCSMTYLAKILSADLHATVVDRTGLKGLFNFKLSFSSGLSDSPDSYPDERTALREQLGLKLVAERGTEEVVTIDHIERPSVN